MRMKSTKPAPQLVLRGEYNEDGLPVRWGWRWENADVWENGVEFSFNLARAKAETALMRSRMVMHAKAPK